MRDRLKQLPVFFWGSTTFHCDTHWQPSADIYSTRTGWLLKVDLAGVRREDITVEVSGSRIRVSGHRRDWVSEAGCRHHSMEISYNCFERIFELPGALEEARIESDYRDGVLLIRVQAEGGKP